MAAQVEHLKWIQGTNFMVDGFNFQNPRCRSYFLTHFHSDHTTGLRKNFSAGVIYCSEITAVLLRKDMGMPPERIIPLPMDTALEIDGVKVTLLDANHCPGSCMFLFELQPRAAAAANAPRVILHVGDMRWHPRLGQHPALRRVRVDLLYLDTTYASPKHVFPSQDAAIAQIVELMRKERKARPGTLFVVGSYHIGKERAFLGAAKALGWRVWCNAGKKKTMQMLRLPEAELALLTPQQGAADIHVTFMGQGLQPEALAQRITATKWTHAVAFRPTGWSFVKSGKLQVRKEGNVTIYGVPYSEHSSFAELRDCVKTLRPTRIIPTVNVTNDPATARLIVDRFADLMDLSRDKSRLDVYFKPRAQRAQRRASAAGEARLPAGRCTSMSAAEQACAGDGDVEGGLASAADCGGGSGNWSSGCLPEAATPAAGADEVNTRATAPGSRDHHRQRRGVSTCAGSQPDDSDVQPCIDGSPGTVDAEPLDDSLSPPSPWDYPDYYPQEDPEDAWDGCPRSASQASSLGAGCNEADAEAGVSDDADSLAGSQGQPVLVARPCEELPSQDAGTFTDTPFQEGSPQPVTPASDLWKFAYSPEGSSQRGCSAHGQASDRSPTACRADAGCHAALDMASTRSSIHAVAGHQETYLAGNQNATKAQPGGTAEQQLAACPSIATKHEQCANNSNSAEDPVIDLESVDVAEQQRMLAYIAASRGLSCKRAAGPSMAVQPKKQLSIAGFLNRKVCAPS